MQESNGTLIPIKLNPTSISTVADTNGTTGIIDRSFSEKIEMNESTSKPINMRKVIREGEAFKIKQCYFKIAMIRPGGFAAIGISREDYYQSKRKKFQNA